MSPDELRQGFPALTRSFGDEDCEAFLAALEPRRFAAGERLSTYGETSGALHLVTAGAVSIHVEKGEDDLILGQATPGCVVGEVGLVEPGPASATLEALEPVETLCLEHERFERLCEEHPAAASKLLRAISLELVHRVRTSVHEVVRRIDDHHWMRVEASRDASGWTERIASLVRGPHRGTP